MTDLSRRELLGLGGAGAGLLAAGASAAADGAAPPRKPVAMLFDTTRCIGCQACVAACAEANGLEPDASRSGGLWQMAGGLNDRTKNVIQLFRGDGAAWSFVKRQCMHCLDPACVSGCPFGALSKDPVTGIVGWDGTRCIGCRYCELACPFDVPKFEWQRGNPAIVKCEFCRHVLAEEGEPACTRVCPAEAVVFGSRSELLAQAHARLAAAPGTYHGDRVYGEEDGGGLQVLYLSHVAFERLGLPRLGPVSVPEQRRSFGQWITKWGLFPLVAYGVVLAFIRRNWRRHEAEARRIEARGGPRDQL